MGDALWAEGLDMELRNQPNVYRLFESKDGKDVVYNQAHYAWHVHQLVALLVAFFYQEK